MSFELFKESRLYSRKSVNLVKLGFNFDNPDVEHEFKSLQHLIHNEYNIKCESMPSIMKQFGIPSSKTLFTLFNLLDIEARSLSDAGLTAYQQDRIPTLPIFIGKADWHTTWDGKKVFLRSSYEKDYATFLDEQQIEYFTEHFRISYYHTVDKRFKTAVPDFYIPSQNKIVEIKSRFWYDEQQMADKQKAYLELGHSFELIMDGKSHILVGALGFEPRKRD